MTWNICSTGSWLIMTKKNEVFWWKNRVRKKKTYSNLSTILEHILQLSKSVSWHLSLFSHLTFKKDKIYFENIDDQKRWTLTQNVLSYFRYFDHRFLECNLLLFWWFFSYRTSDDLENASLQKRNVLFIRHDISIEIEHILSNIEMLFSH